jgi:hypothetical protein
MYRKCDHSTVSYPSDSRSENSDFLHSLNMKVKQCRLAKARVSIGAMRVLELGARLQQNNDINDSYIDY